MELLSIALSAVAVLLALLYLWKSKSSPKAPPQVRGLPVVGSPDFFRKRWDFIQSNLARHGRFFSFRLLQHQVFCVAGGPDARKTYFSTPEHTVSFNQGYRILFPGTPKLTEEPPNNDDFGQLLLKALSRNRTRDAMPVLIGDIYDAVKSWGSQGTIDPFYGLYSIVFQLSCRMLGANEIADDPETVKKLTEFYWELERGSGAVPVLLPWLPTPAKKRHQAATVGLYTMIVAVIQKRRDESRRENDTLQVLMDSGKSDPEIVQMMLTFFFAAIVNTGIGSAWLLLHLTNNAEWRSKILRARPLPGLSLTQCVNTGFMRSSQELNDTIAKYRDSVPAEDVVSTGVKVDPRKPLQYLPMSAWEDTPMLDLAIKEVLRLTMSGTSLRRVLKPGVVIEGYEIPVGSFLCYPLGITHLNEKIYKDPHKFDPDRFLPPRSEEDSETFSFLGWGIGKHPCLGMKFAKLEMKSILAVLLTSFEFKLAAKGALPEPDRNNLHTTRPKAPAFVSYKALPNTLLSA